MYVIKSIFLITYILTPLIFFYFNSYIFKEPITKFTTKIGYNSFEET